MHTEELQEIETPEVEVDVAEVESGEVESQEEDEVVVSIGDEKPEEEEHEEEARQAPSWVKELRRSQRELQKENRELKRQIQSAQAPAEKEKPKLGPRPTLEGCDYDEERYTQEIDAWYDKKRQADAMEAQAAAEAQKAEQAWQAKLEGYAKAKGELKVRDYEEAEDVARDVLSVTQQAIILQGADNPALVVYALGKNPAKAKELAAITDTVQYAFAIAKLEAQLKVSNRKAPPPERVASTGSAAISGSVDSNLERLRSEAAKTGDYSKVIAYKNAQRKK